MILYHYTCDDHGFPGILAAGRITPCPQPLLHAAPPIIWLTDALELSIRSVNRRLRSGAGSSTHPGGSNADPNTQVNGTILDGERPRGEGTPGAMAPTYEGGGA